MSLKQLKCDFNYQNISKQIIEKQRHENSEHKVMIKILDRLSDCSEKENDIKDVIKDIESDSNYDMSGDVVNQVSKNERLIRTLIDIVSENNATKRLFRIVEINVSSELFADCVTKLITESQIKPKQIQYRVVRKLDELGEISNSDLVILRDSYQLWNNIEGMINIFKAISEKHFIIVVFKYRLTEPEEAINSVLNAESSITNSQLDHKITQLIKISLESGLRLIASKCDSVSTMAMMFRKVTENIPIPDNSDVIEVKAERDEKWFEAIRKSLQKSEDAFDAGKKPNNVWLIANDTHINGIVGLVNSLRFEKNGEFFRCIFDMDSKIEIPINWKLKPYSDILTNDLVINVIKDGKLGTYRHLKLGKNYDKIVSNKYFLNQSVTNDISSLTWFDSSKYEQIIELSPQGQPFEYVPVHIYSSGLIFKDIMTAIG